MRESGWTDFRLRRSIVSSSSLSIGMLLLGFNIYIVGTVLKQRSSPALTMGSECGGMTSRR